MSKFTIIDNVRKTVDQQYQFLKEQNVRIEGMYNDYNDLLEYKQVMEASRDLLEGDRYQGIRDRLNDSVNEPDQSLDRDSEEIRRLMNVPEPSEVNSDLNQSVNEGSVKVGRVVGTCLNDELLKLERLLFRSTRGNSLVVTKNTGGIVTYDKKVIPKSVFIVIFQEGHELRQKIETISQFDYKLPIILRL